jgi:hypothetical protein
VTVAAFGAVGCLALIKTDLPAIGQGAGVTLRSIELVSEACSCFSKSTSETAEF